MLDKSNLPVWAEWIAQDADGTWWAYEVEPLQFHKGWYENEVGRNYKIAREEPSEDWRKTLMSLRAL